MNDECGFQDWHREVLEERERLIACGEAKFIDWEQAKAEIRQAVATGSEIDNDCSNIPRVPGLH